MRKLLILICLFISAKLSAQVYQVMPQYGYQTARMRMDSVLIVPSDTIRNKSGVARIGTQLYAGNGSYWTRTGGSDSSVFFTKFRSDTMRANVYNAIANVPTPTLQDGYNVSGYPQIIYDAGKNFAIKHNGNSDGLYFNNSTKDILLGDSSKVGSYLNLNTGADITLKTPNEIILNPDSAQTGYVWTAKNNSGHGEWRQPQTATTIYTGDGTILGNRRVTLNQDNLADKFEIVDTDKEFGLTIKANSNAYGEYKAILGTLQGGTEPNLTVDVYGIISLNNALVSINKADSSALYINAPLSNSVANDDSLLVINSSGMVKKAAKSTGADSSTYFTTYRADTMRSNLYSNKVPYTGATQDVDLGAFKLNAQSVHIKGTAGAGHLGLKHQSAAATASGNETSLYANSNGDIAWKNDNLYITTLKTSGNTANRVYTFPDSTGTVALLDNVNLKANIASPTFTGTVTIPTLQVNNRSSLEGVNIDKDSLPITTTNRWALTVDTPTNRIQRYDLRQKADTTGATFTGAVGIGAVPVSTAQLNVSSTTSGILIPRMTTTQRNAISTPATGLMIYNTTDSSHYTYDGVRWNRQLSANGLQTITGTPQTGSSANGILDLAQTWNTTGTPSAIKLNVTNTASNGNSRLMDLQVGGVSQFRVQTNSGVYVGNNTSFAGMRYNADQLLLTSNITGTTAGDDFNFTSGQGTRTFTTGTNNVINIRNGASQAFAPTSGTGVLNIINIPTVINQTGGANGITRGLHINPTLTSAADWRAIETTNGQLRMSDTYAAGSGSLAGSLLDLSQTWNTTGTPTAIKLNVTNTASNAASRLLDLQVGGVSQFNVRRNGDSYNASGLYLGTNSATTNGILPCDPPTGSITITSQNDVSLRLSDFRNLSNAGYSFWLSSLQYTGLNYTSGTGGYLTIPRGFIPTSGTGVFNALNLANTINQTGGANGITRGLYVNPTLTSAADFRAIETTNGQLRMSDTYAAGSGSLAGSLLDLSQTWNTTGNPAAIRLNVTNTASGSTASLIDLQVGGTSYFTVDKGAKITQFATNTAAGTTGNQTINRPTGTVNIAAAGTTVTVTNNLVTENSLVFAVIRTNDATATIKNVVPGAGTFTINLNAATTAETSIGFWVIN